MSKKNPLREWSEAIVFALLAAFIIRNWFYAPFRVPTGSMIPTIEIGDQIIADMNDYGFKIPFSNNKIWRDEVLKGDIVIFPNPENPTKCEDFLYSSWDSISALVIGIFNSNHIPKCVDYIKRVVATGGDKVEIVGETVLINNMPENEYRIYLNPNLSAKNIYYQETVPKDNILVMGDNRRDSYDARFWKINGAALSYIPKSKIKAKGKFIYFSSDPKKSIFQGGIRWERILKKLK